MVRIIHYAWINAYTFSLNKNARESFAGGACEEAFSSRFGKGRIGTAAVHILTMAKKLI